MGSVRKAISRVGQNSAYTIFVRYTYGAFGRDKSEYTTINGGAYTANPFITHHLCRPKQTKE